MRNTLSEIIVRISVTGKIIISLSEIRPSPLTFALGCTPEAAALLLQVCDRIS